MVLYVISIIITFYILCINLVILKEGADLFPHNSFSDEGTSSDYARIRKHFFRATCYIIAVIVACIAVSLAGLLFSGWIGDTSQNITKEAWEVMTIAWFIVYIALRARERVVLDKYEGKIDTILNIDQLRQLHRKL